MEENILEEDIPDDNFVMPNEKLKNDILEYINVCMDECTVIPNGATSNEFLKALRIFDFTKQLFIPQELLILQNIVTRTAENLKNLKYAMSESGNDMNLFLNHQKIISELKNIVSKEFGEVSINGTASFQIYVGYVTEGELLEGKPYSLYIGSCTLPAIDKRWHQHKNNTNSGATRLQDFMDKHGRDSITFETLFSLPDNFRYHVVMYWFEAFMQIAFNCVNSFHGLNSVVGQPGQTFYNDRQWLEKFKTCLISFMDTGTFKGGPWLKSATRKWRSNSLCTPRQKIFDFVMPSFGISRVPMIQKTNREWLNLVLEFHQEYGVLPSFSGKNKSSEIISKYGRVSEFIGNVRTREFSSNGNYRLTAEEREYVLSHDILKFILQNPVDKLRDKFRVAAKRYVDYVKMFREKYPGRKFNDQDLSFRNKDSQATLKRSRPPNAEFLTGLCSGNSKWTNEKKNWLMELAKEENCCIYTEIIDYVESKLTPEKVARQRELLEKEKEKKKTSRALKKKQRIAFSIQEMSQKLAK